MLNEALIIGSQRDCCYVIKEFLELRDLSVTVVLDYKEGIDKLFDEKPLLSVIEITDREISPAFIANIRNSNEFSILDFTTDNQTIGEGNQVFILDDTSRINALFDYLKSNTPVVTRVRDSAEVQDEGSLEYIFYPNLLLDIYRKERTGILSISSSDTVLKIYFKNGSPVYAEGGDSETGIGRILLNSGRITPETHKEILDKAWERKKRITEVLIDMKTISPHELNTYLELQTEEMILRGFCCLSGEYSFGNEARFPDSVVEYKIKLPKVLNEAVKRFIYAEEIEARNPKIKMEGKPQSDINAMELKPRELRMVQLLKNNMSVKEILETTRLEKYEALKLLYLLGLFKVIDLPGVSLESMGRKSAQRYISENAILAEASEDPDITKDREELIELEVYESEEEITDVPAPETAQADTALKHLSQESASGVPADAPEIEDSKTPDKDIEDMVLTTDENLVSIFGDNEAVLEDTEENIVNTERSPESLLEDEAGDIPANEDAQVYGKIDMDKNPLSEEIVLDSHETDTEPGDARDIEITIDVENEDINAGEDTPGEFEIDSYELLDESQSGQRGQDIDPYLFSGGANDANTELEMHNGSLNETPREISIDDRDLFSTFENTEALEEAALEIGTHNELLMDGPPGTDTEDIITDPGSAFAQRILEFHRELADKDYYQILGVAEDSDVGSIRDAYYKLVKDYHPDVNQNIPGDIREKAQEIFTTINSAYETLSDSEKRETYDSQDQLSELKTQAKSIYEAEIEFKKGQTLLSQRNYNEAKIKLGEALKMNPEESAYIGAYTWASFLDSEDKNKIVEDSIEDLIKAIDLNADIAENYYYLGSIYKSKDDINKAEQNYEKAVEVDPNYIEAKRELRLINTRKRKNTKDSKIERRFWSSLFKQ